MAPHPKKNHRFQICEINVAFFCYPSLNRDESRYCSSFCVKLHWPIQKSVTFQVFKKNINILFMHCNCKYQMTIVETLNMASLSLCILSVKRRIWARNVTALWMCKLSFMQRGLHYEHSSLG